MSGSRVQDLLGGSGLEHRGDRIDGGNKGHRPAVKGGYFPVPPVDSLQNIRSAMCTTLEQIGVDRGSSPPRSRDGRPERNRHQVRSAGSTRRLVDAFEVRRSQRRRTGTARRRHSCPSRSSATTVPVCTCISRSGKGRQNLFAGDGYAGLSEFAIHYIGGIIKHAKALNAITNPGTNSYKRLVPGFEAPINLAYSARNRSAAVRVPLVTSAEGSPY